MFKQKLLIAFLTAVLTAQTALPAEKSVITTGEKTNFDFSSLKIEKAQEPLHFSQRSGQRKIPAEYAAVFTIHPQMRILSSGRFHEMGKRFARIVRFHEEILDTPAGKKLSSSQKSFLSSGKALLKRINTSETNGFYILGVDEEQTLNTAKAFFQALTKRNENNYKKALKQLQQAEEDYKKAKKHLQSYKEKRDSAQEDFKKIKQQTHYRSDDQASETIKRMNQLIQNKTIELAALSEKRRIVSNERVNLEKGDLLTKLNVIYVNVEMDLAAGRATRNTASRIRENAEKYLDLHQQYKGANGSYQRYRSPGTRGSYYTAKTKLSKAKEKAAEWKNRLNLKVKDNKITLHPVNSVN